MLCVVGGDKMDECDRTTLLWFIMIMVSVIVVTGLGVGVNVVHHKLARYDCVTHVSNCVEEPRKEEVPWGD